MSGEEYDTKQFVQKDETREKVSLDLISFCTRE